MELGLKNKVAIVTGGSRGIGRAVCLALAREGAKIILNDVVITKETYKTVEDIKKENTEVMTIQADVSKWKDVENLVTKTVEEFGRIDILINNAGIVPGPTSKIPLSPVQDILEDEWKKVIDVDLTGVFFCCHFVVEQMIKQKSGKIVSVSSLAARRGSVSHRSHYAAAKAGILGFTKALAREVAPYNINVNAVLPGIIATFQPETAAGRTEAWIKEIPLGRFGRPEEAANVILFLVSNSASYLTGISVDINGGQYMY